MQEGLPFESSFEGSGNVSSLAESSSEEDCEGSASDSSSVSCTTVPSASSSVKKFNLRWSRDVHEFENE